MSGGYEVVLGKIDAASGAARRAVGAVKPVDLAGALGGVAPALPGGVSGEAARMLANARGTAASDWVKNTGEYADQLETAVRGYRSNEQSAEHDLRVAANGGARPV